MKRFNLLCCIAIFSYSTGMAQSAQFMFEHLTTRDGLSSAGVNAILQDQKGFLWFATENGVNRYDGQSVRVYRHNPTDTNSLSHNYIWSFAEDKGGYLWIGTDGGGLNRFDPVTTKFTRYYSNPDDSTSISGDIIQYVYVDRNDDVWAGTWGKGLNKYNRDNDTFTRFMHEPGNSHTLGNDNIFCIFEDRRNNLWIATDGGSVSVIDRETYTFTHFRHDPDDPASIGSDIILSIYEDSRGNIWFGTYTDVVSRFDYTTNSFTNFSAETTSFAGSMAWSIIEDSEGIIWIGTITGGIFLFDYESESFMHVAHNPYNSGSINSDHIRSMYEDESGVLWIGTVMNGLNKTDRKPKKFTHLAKDLNNPNSLADNTISAILEDSDGILWFGSLTNGLSAYDPANDRYIHFASEPDNPNTLNGEMIKYLFEDNEGTIWIGTYFSVLNTYDKTTDTFTHQNLEALGNFPAGANNIRSIHQDSEGVYWFGVHGGGIIRYDKSENSFMRFSKADSKPTKLSSDYITVIVEDENNNLWIGTHGGGLNKFNKNTETFTSYPSRTHDANSISDNLITDIHISKGGRLWIGTYAGGLIQFDEASDTFTSFRETEGLASDMVCGIIEDDHGLLWLNTGQGVSKFDPAHSTFRNYDYGDGIRQGECNPGASVKTRSGWIYFGGIDGVTSFHPDNVYDNAYKPPVVVTSIRINNIEQAETNPAYTDRIELYPGDYSLSLEFAALDFTLPSRNEYAVFLEGLDDEWNYIGSRRFTNYTNLSPGTYVLNVKGSNHNRIWNDEPTWLFIKVHPPFWATWWFRSGFLIAIIGLLYYSRTSTLRKERRAQEKISKHLIESQEKERKRIAAELHDSLGQHLLIIKNRALLGLENQDIETLSEQMQVISDLTSNTINEVREISYNLRPYQLDRLGLKEAIDSVIARITNSTSIKCSASIEALNRTFPKEAEINIYRIVQELLNNIVKHSEADTVSIHSVFNNGELTLTVSDNGKGFDTDILKADTKHRRGFGLIGMQERVKILKGSITIYTTDDRGTTVKISFPVKDTNNA
jgi:signal transduction histidine kinase/ligand-binding sensor domain-containing protein